MSRTGLPLRLIFLAVLVSGLVAWLQWRKPRACPVELDLTSMLPGELTEIDLVVLRDGRGLFRLDTHYGPRGAPGLLQFEVQARPGPAEVEATLLYAPGTPARRTRAQVTLAEDLPSRVYPR